MTVGMAKGIELLTSESVHLRSVVLDYLRRAQTSIDIAHSRFEAIDVAQAVADKARRGAQVRCLMRRLSPHVSNLLADAGAQIVLANDRPLTPSLHLKLVIIDSQTVLTGSTNLFDRSLDKDAETLLVLTHRPLVSAATVAFEQVLEVFVDASANHGDIGLQE